MVRNSPRTRLLPLFSLLVPWRLGWWTYQERERGENPQRNSHWQTPLLHTGSPLLKVCVRETVPLVVFFHSVFLSLGCPTTYAYLSARMILNGMWCGINGRATAIRMCPPLTTKNWVYYVPHVAVGTASGMIYVASLSAEQVVQEIAVHTCPVQ